MEIVEIGAVLIMVLSIGAFGVYQARKTRRLQNEYKTLTKAEKERLNKESWDDPKLFMYSKPMSKSMLVISIISVVFLIWALIENAAL